MIASITKRLSWRLRFSAAKLAVWLLQRTGFYASYWGHWRSIFCYVESKGLHILPVHYYSPIPDTRNLSDDLWKKIRTPIGFELSLDAALNWLDDLNERYGAEYRQFPREPDDNDHRYYLENGAYRSGDAEVSYAILRDVKPQKIIEIGSGYSTRLISQAIRANKNEDSKYRCEFTAIEPFPPPMLRPPPPELTRLEKIPLQEVPTALFTSLTKGDVLFIDSSHVARIGSDVILEYLQLLPRLPSGVLVHIHDIFIPADYPRWWIERGCFFWNEQYLLEAFLTFNREFEVIMPTHALWRLHEQRFCRAIPFSETGLHTPSSFWIRRC
jgi:hypothetical protein